MNPEWIAKINSMSLRERAMLFVIAAALLIFLISALLIDPLQAKQHAIALKIVQQQQEMHELQTAIQSIKQSRLTEQNSPLHAQIAALRAQWQENNAFLQSAREKLVEPDKMAGLLQAVLRNNDKLQLTGLETLPPALLLEPAKGGKATANSAPQIYKHGVEIKLRGGYADLLHYLEALEKMPEHLFWGELNLTVDQYPESVLTLTMYTLSLDKTWLTI